MYFVCFHHEGQSVHSPEMEGGMLQVSHEAHILTRKIEIGLPNLSPLSECRCPEIVIISPGPAERRIALNSAALSVVPETE